VRIEEAVYFAPGLLFSDVHLAGPEMPIQLGRRIRGFYLEPAARSCDRGDAFAAGLIAVSCIDAIARLMFEAARVGERFERFAREKIKMFAADDLAHRFYEDFRNGLVHEARIKRGGQFSLQYEDAVRELGSVLVINPGHLLREIDAAMTQFLEQLVNEEAECARVAAILRNDFDDDFRDVRFPY